MNKNLSRESLQRSIRVIARLTFFVAVIMVVDAIGLGVFLYSQGALQYFAFMQSLILLMLLEGSLITAIGGFLFFGSSGRRAAKQGKMSPAVSIIVIGLLTILIGFLTSALTQI